MALIHVCNKIEAVGVKIDRKFIEAGLKYEHGEIKKAKEDFEADTGRAYVNSSKLFAEIFESRGEKYPLTDKGNPSFKKDFLEDMDTPTALLINRIRYHEKRASTYWSSFLYYADSYNVLHPRLNQAGTVTGRFSSSNPNMQNMPKEDEEEDKEKQYIVRRSFKPRPGFKFYSIDYNQMEYRMMLDITGEKELIDAVNSGEDVHTATARILGIPRKQAKTVNFALLFGTGNKKLAKMLGVTEQKAKDIKYLYFSKLPNVKSHIYNITKTGETRGYVYNWLGRVYWCGNFDFSYKLPNHLIQGGCADVIKKAMVEIEAQIPDHNMRLQVHDELIFELEDSRIDILPKIKSIMESVYVPRNGMPLTVSIKRSSRSMATHDMEEMHEGVHF